MPQGWHYSLSANAMRFTEFESNIKKAVYNRQVVLVN